MFEIEVNNQKIEARPGETILAALNRAGIKVPTLCHMDNLTPTGACRLCVVEVEGCPHLVPSCSHPVEPGMKIKTNSGRAVRARTTILELLLSNHPDDCLYCARNGNCQLQKLSEEYGIRDRRYSERRRFDVRLDISSPALVREKEKCILCGKCVRVCEEVQGVAAIDFINRGSETIVGPAFNQSINVSSCVTCGQCVMVCPTGALREGRAYKDVVDALNDPEKFVIVQYAPSISVTLADVLNLRQNVDVNGLLVTALRRIGFDKVFDTSFAADLTVMEEASELVRRINSNQPLPMMSSCSPGWVKFVEQFYPELMGNLSTCKSPQQMFGAILKSRFADSIGVKPRNIFSVSVMPCTAKKFEARRPEMGRDNIHDVDAVLTTRELGRLISMYGIDFGVLPPDQADSPFSTRATSGKLFGVSGGMTEATLRTTHFLLTGKEMRNLRMESLRGSENIKEIKLKVGGMRLGAAVVNGLGNARKLLDKVKRGERPDLHFIEVMTCPGGCVAGGGQPIGTDAESIRTRGKALHAIDQIEPLRVSHMNPDVLKLYSDFLGEPLSEKCQKLLHTKFMKREIPK